MAQHQFSLRSALVAVAVLCAVIALFVWNAAAALLIVGAIRSIDCDHRIHANGGA